MLHIAKNLSLPATVFAQHMAVLGKTRSGKSSVLRLFVESLLDRKERVCVIDPKGDWHGLRSSADGKKAGYGVVIFGGSHQDVPLSEHGGKSVAELVATGNRPCVIDLGGWMVGERTRFFVDFASTLFRAIDSPLHLVIDEVHNFAPQQKIEKNPDAMKMLHWANRLGSEGAGKGLVIFSASQRPQKVHKDFLTCAETLVAMRVIHVLDRNAIKDWIDGAGDATKGKEVLDTLASLARGEGWMWSPEAKFGPQRVKFPLFKTYDSFAAPTAGQSQKPLKGWASVDLEEVKEKLAASIEAAKANDPAELKKQIADLKRQLSAKPAAAVGQHAIDRAVAAAEKTRDQHWQQELAAIQKAHGSVVGKLQRGRALAEQIVALAELNGDATVNVTAPAASKPVAAAHRPTPPVSTRRQAEPVDAAGVSSRQQRFLDAAAALTTLGSEVTRETVSAWVGVHPRGGSVGEELKALQDAGLIGLDRGRISVTEQGMGAAGEVDVAQAINSARAGLTSRQTKFFDLIVDAYPNGTTREAIAEHFGIHPRGGSLGEDLGRLVGRGLVEGSRGHYRARDFLFAGQRYP